MSGGRFQRQGNVARESRYNIDPRLQEYLEGWRGEEGLYVLELRPGLVKVGRSANLGQRVATHVNSARVYGVFITSAHLVKTPAGKSDVGEKRLLAELRAEGARIHNETFSVGYEHAKVAADRVADGLRDNETQ